jgi:hypothetical protein
LLGALLVPALAQAQTNCADIVGENKTIYGSGGSAIRETIRKVAAALRAQDTLILYSDGGGACVGFADYVAGTAPAARPYRYWNAAAVESTCIAPEVAPQFAHMGNPVSDCAGAELPEGVKDFGGPVQTLNIFTDIDSNYNSISAEAWKFLLLHGPAASEISPWTEDLGLIIRDTASFVHLFASKAVGVDPAATKGVKPDAGQSTNQNSVNRTVAFGANNADAAIGYASGSAADANRTVIKTLAYQDFGQTCSYWPDSDQNSTDRINVRTGLYALWTPGHFYAEEDEDGNIADPDVAELVGWITGSLDSPGDLDVTRKVIEAGDVPQCAMRATREGLTGAIASYAPPKPCDCYFESIATKEVPSYCDACTDDDDCAGGERTKCNYGFCELYRED